MREIPGLKVGPSFAKEPLLLPPSADRNVILKNPVLFTTIVGMNLFQAMFAPSMTEWDSELAELIAFYSKIGAYCGVGELPSAEPSVKKITLGVAAKILKYYKPPTTEHYAEIREAHAFGFLFAALIGTSTLASNVAARLKMHPIFLELWNRSPYHFMLEQARIKSPGGAGRWIRDVVPFVFCRCAFC